MAHFLRYGAAAHTSLLRANPQHTFAHTFAILMYDSGAVYSMIPKNGCTTLRLSIACANGVISDLADWEWIHQNNDSFRPSFKDLALASYRFTVLRCPYGRLVSCFLDKIVRRTADASQFVNASKSAGSLGQFTFRGFCAEIAKPQVRRANMHWRPQTDFLVYSDYDDYFCFEDFSRIAPRLRARIGMPLVDARPLARHDSSQFKTVHASHSFADVPLLQLEAMLLNGFYPQPKRFYDDGLAALVADIYADDFTLYRKRCPGMGMFDAQAAGADWMAAV